MISAIMPMRLSRIGLLTVAMAVLGVGCAPKVKIPVQSPAEISTIGIKKVAIGSFEVAMADRSAHIERNGEWRVERMELTQEGKERIAKQIRAKVVNALSLSSYFSLVYTDEFAELENDAALQKLISAEGYKTRQVDAVINGKIWLQLQKTDGSEVGKSDMKFVQGGSSEGLDLSVQKVLWWPYKSMRGNLTVEIKLTRLTPTEIVAVYTDTKTFGRHVGGKPEESKESARELLSVRNAKERAKLESSDAVFPSFAQLASDLASSIAAEFVGRVAVTEKWVEREVAAGGDFQAKLLIEAGAYEMAIDRLGRVTSGKRRAADFYNLGLAFEAIGEYGLARTSYNDAWEIDKSSLLFAQGLGRIEKVLRENPRVRRQLAEKRN